jgi:hypothetical protein
LSYLPEGLREAGRWQKPAQGTKSLSKPEPELTREEAAVWEILGRQSHAHVDAIAGELGAPAWDISRIVMEMEISGHLTKRLDGCYERS